MYDGQYTVETNALIIHVAKAFVFADLRPFGKSNLLHNTLICFPKDVFKEINSE